MYSDFYNDNLVTQTTSSSVDTTWMVISLVLALVVGVVGYFLFVSTKNNGEYKGFVAWLHDFLNFKTFFIEMVLKVLYIVATVFITLSSFSFLGSSVATFFLWLILGNIINRVAFEFILMFLTLVNNTTEINKKMGTQKKETTEKPKKREKEKEKEEE